jgi:uncharacterized membrane-anchored protein YitT (DUF2179 family)
MDTAANRKVKVILGKFQKQGKVMAKKLLGIIVGAILMAISYNALVIPYKLLSGGISGLSLIGKYSFGIPMNIGILILNIPVFLWGLKELDRSFMAYSVVGTLVLVVALPITEPFIQVPQLDLILASIFSGIVGGIGCGIMLKVGASSGGTDVISMIMKKKANIPVGSFSFYFNVIVLGLSLFFFDLKIALYTFISMWVSGRMVDYVLEGLNRKKSVTIISDKNDIIASRIMEELHRGVTYLVGEGGFTGEKKLVISSIVNNFENAKIKEILAEVDPKAFMFITDAVEVSGKGFTMKN